MISQFFNFFLSHLNCIIVTSVIDFYLFSLDTIFLCTLLGKESSDNCTSDENGKHDSQILAIGDANKITIKNDKGNVIGSMYDMGYTSDFYYMVDFFSEPLKTNKITIEGSIGSVERRNETLIKGNWNFSFDIGMKKANKLPEDKSYCFVLDAYTIAEMYRSIAQIVEKLLLLGNKFVFSF
ncbi:hypothetical protein [Paenibacillus polymyxa]|uniref:hypothetical protein n=1 Tax=Paenibacillus polymyxa TaxID=1406 RepID=UPI00215553C9|nr:hypothetical protein [Paenibacillus polymyxa]